MVMQVNMLDAKNQLSPQVKAALAGEEVIIASHGKAQVRLVPFATARCLERTGILAEASPELLSAPVDAAFSEAVDQQVAQLFIS
jgi:prevent-host-death family protein